MTRKERNRKDGREDEIRVSVSEKEKKAYAGEAERAGLTTSAWVRFLVNERLREKGLLP